MTWLTTTDGIKLRISDRRPRLETRPPIVLVHGWKQSHRLFDRAALHLTELGHRVISYDSRGMGESDKPDGKYEFKTLARDLSEVLTATGVKSATLVGWSMGCSVSLEFLTSYSSHHVEKLVLHNGPLRLTHADDFVHAMTLAQFNDYLRAAEQSWPRSERDFQRESLLPEADESLVDFLWHVAMQTPLDIAIKLARQQSRLDHRQVLRKLQIPVLALYSRSDPYYPVSLAHWIALQATDGRVVELCNSAHCAPLEEPETFAAEISKFSQQPDGTVQAIEASRM